MAAEVIVWGFGGGALVCGAVGFSACWRAGVERSGEDKPTRRVQGCKWA